MPVSDRSLGQRLVDAATPRFKDFRVDFERISNAASRKCREEGSDATALAMYLDSEWHLRGPLQRRYIAKGAIEPLAHYHAKRFKLELGRNEPWPDGPAWDALTLFAEAGRADAGVALIRSYGDMQHKRLKRDYSARNPRGSRKARDAGTERILGTIKKVVADSIPAGKADLLRDLEAVAPYVDRHGSDDDRAWLESLRREVWMEKRA